MTLATERWHGEGSVEGPVTQLAECCPYKAKAFGSNPNRPMDPVAVQYDSGVWVGKVLSNLG